MQLQLQHKLQVLLCLLMVVVQYHHYLTVWQGTQTLLLYYSPVEQTNNNSTITGLDKLLSRKLYLFSYASILTYVLGAQKNRLIEPVLLSTHNICFG